MDKVESILLALRNGKKVRRIDGTIKPNQDLDYVFRRSQNQLKYAGITQAIPGIKKRNL